jgi:hypothetical protein
MRVGKHHNCIHVSYGASHAVVLTSGVELPKNVHDVHVHTLIHQENQKKPEAPFGHQQNISFSSSRTVKLRSNYLKGRGERGRGYADVCAFLLAFCSRGARALFARLSQGCCKVVVRCSHGGHVVSHVASLS